MRLFIAEKPSLAREIAAGLGVISRENGLIRCRDENIVTWCFGHLYELCDPEDYDPAWKRWDLNTLPMVPDKWRRKPRGDKGVSAQLVVIKKLLSQASRIVNAGDPDREGQLLVDEVLEELGNRKPVDRIWLASLDDKSVRHALADIKPNSQYRSLRDAAEARSRADWLVGLNMTRALTCRGRASGFDGVVSAGRVQSPTLMLVVKRDLEIEAFKSVTYYVPTLKVKHANGEFTVTLVIDESVKGVDAEGRLADRNVAQVILQGLEGQAGVIHAYSSEEKRQSPSLPYRLSSLQKEASSRFGFSAQKTLDIAQSLYEEKLTTYPRTDCDYLPEEQFEDARRILKALSGHKGYDKADASRKSKAWNTGKITAHHAIIPTGQRAGMDGDQNKIYGLIAEGYIRQFLPDYRYASEKVEVSMADRKWVGSGTRVIEPGWKIEAESNPLPTMAKGDQVTCISALVDEKETQPPSRYTEGTLIEAMANVHKYVQDERKRALLKENSGIGTEATRAGIIETLKRRGYLGAKGKQLISTTLGRQVVKFMPSMLTDPGTTAIWEDYLERVGKGEVSVDAFIEKQAKAVVVLIQSLGNMELDVKPKHACAECGSALRRHESKNRKGTFYWTCSRDFNHPRYSDNRGKPGDIFGANGSASGGGSRFVTTPCVHPGCDGEMRRMESTKKKGAFFWVCSNRNHPLYRDDQERPGEPFEKR